MFLGNPPEIKEHLLTKHIDDCSFKIARRDEF